MRIAQKGFTLIELLVVIVVIAVLVAVTATMYQNAGAIDVTRRSKMLPISLLMR